MTNNLLRPHTGGDCPVDPEIEVEVMYASGLPNVPLKAKCLGWRWDRVGGYETNNIIAYRIVEQPKADWEKWFDNYRDSRIDGPAVTFEQLYQAIAARLKAEGE